MSVLRSLRARYLIGSLLVFATMLVLLLWSAQSLMRETLEARFKTELDTHEPILVAAVEPLLVTRDYGQLNELVGDSVGPGRLALMEVRDQDGRVLAVALREDVLDPADAASAATATAASAGRSAADLGASNRVRLREVTIQVGGQRLGTLRVGLGTQDLIDARARLWTQGLAIGGGVLVLGALLLALTTHGVTAGIQRLAQASARIAEGHTTVTLPDDGVREVAQVSRAFNRMSEAIQAQLDALRAGHDALESANARLEQRVQERTIELQTALHAAEAGSRAKSEFLSRMSHELRTPLNAILGFAQLLALTRTDLPESDRQKLQQIQTAGWHLLALIDEILDLARIEAGALSVSLEPVDLCRLADEAMELLRPAAAGRTLHLESLLPEQGPRWVLADRKRLTQVLHNLLSNAVKYNRERGFVRLQVLPAPAGRVRLAVSDGGRGMSPAQVAQLFQPFTRFADPTETVQGTGIGLVITRRLLEVMDGRIEVESSPGQGSVFTIDLPAASAPEPRDPPITGFGGLEGLSAREAAPTRRRVLYVEDNPSNIELLRSVMALRPEVDLLVETDGEAGLSHLMRLRPDLAVIDIDLPRLDGLSLCRAVRAEPALRDLPLIALSAKAMRADLRAMERAGFDACLTKPLEVQRFFDELDRLMPVSHDD
jgi:signal transduction histidine kinase/CheY-like chemotaxis protein